MVGEEEISVQIQTPKFIGVAPSKTFDPDRTCWCGQRLSVYNPAKTCYLHTPIKPKVRRR